MSFRSLYLELRTLSHSAGLHFAVDLTSRYSFHWGGDQYARREFIHRVFVHKASVDQMFANRRSQYLVSHPHFQASHCMPDRTDLEFANVSFLLLLPEHLRSGKKLAVTNPFDRKAHTLSITWTAKQLEIIGHYTPKYSTSGLKRTIQAHELRCRYRSSSSWALHLPYGVPTATGQRERGPREKLPTRTLN